MKRIHVLISGKVQMVGLRSFIKRNAILLNLRGYVKNTENGNVEAVFEGPEEDIKKMIELCRQGSEASKIENVEVKEEEYNSEYSEFSIKL
jgi:acylphosphatase